MCTRMHLARAQCTVHVHVHVHMHMHGMCTARGTWRSGRGVQLVEALMRDGEATAGGYVARAAHGELMREVVPDAARLQKEEERREA